MMYPFERYRKDRCNICLRRNKCMGLLERVGKEDAPIATEGPLAMVLCAQLGLFKGPGDEGLLTE